MPPLWDKHKEDTPYCNCRTCYTARRQVLAAKYATQLYYGQGLQRPHRVSEGEPLEVRVRRDIDEIVDGLVLETTTPIHPNGIELPAKPVDISKYEDAYEMAIKNCPHVNTTNILYQREWSCDDCGKYFDRAEYMRIQRTNFYRFRQ